jgi:hypothetical protein
MDGYAGGPPVAAAGSDIGAKPGSQVSLDGSASADAFGQIASYAWRQVSGNPITLANAGAVRASFTAPSSNGTIELELTVTDGSGNTASDRLVVTISANGGGTGGTGTGTGDDSGVDDVYGGCTTHRGGTGPALLFILGLLLVRRRRAL